MLEIGLSWVVQLTPPADKPVFLTSDIVCMWNDPGISVTLQTSASSIARAIATRGVQYVHWVMHKCIMVKVGGKRNTQKACRKQVNFSKTGGKFWKVGGK